MGKKSTEEVKGKQRLMVLFEHASGFALFRAKGYEDIGSFLPQVEQSVSQAGLFASLIKIVAYTPFATGLNALENFNYITEGVISEDLQNFLEQNLPLEKASRIQLGVSEPKLGGAIMEKFGITCSTTGVVPEITRGIRRHFSTYIEGLPEITQSKAQLGLGHSSSRAKLKFNVNRADNMIIQSINLLDQLDKDINTFAMRVKEWYSYHFPELTKIVSDNSTYTQLVYLIKDRSNLTEEMLPQIEEVVNDSAKAEAILSAARSSFGVDVSEIDMENIDLFSVKVLGIMKYRKKLASYLQSRMGSVAPNLASLIGESVGARLISHAGSLINLAKCPASTIQILGAEKALFRALKRGGKTPKYGLIYHSTYIGKASSKDKGRISRFLSNKCAVAARIDCFSENPNAIIGTKLREMVEDRLRYCETGVQSKSNEEFMAEALEEYNSYIEAET